MIRKEPAIPREAARRGYYEQERACYTQRKNRSEEDMIITVTMNPAMDKTITVEKLQVGELNKVLSAREDAGGKGINVSKTIKSFGGESIAIGFLGGSAGNRIRDMLHENKIKEHFISIQNETRTNLKIADRTGCVTEINEAGPLIDKNEMHMFYEMLEKLVSPKDLVVFSGSMPKGLPADFYRQMIEEVHTLGAVAFLDADGEAFSEGLKAKPDIVKPNIQELRHYFKSIGGDNNAGAQGSAQGNIQAGAQGSVQGNIQGSIPNSVQEVNRMGRILWEQGIPEVIISMGGDGALFVSEDGSYYAPALSVPVCSTVGAGDAMVAAYAYARMQGKKMEERIRFCMAVSAGAVTTQGTNPADASLIERLQQQVQIEKQQ